MDAKRSRFKVIIAAPVAYALYSAGHVVSLSLNFAPLYPVYNRLMVWSLHVNDWAGLRLWANPSDGAPVIPQPTPERRDFVPGTDRLTKILWALFPFALVGLCFQISCEPSTFPDLSFWRWHLYIWTFGAGACTPFSARVYLVSAGVALIVYCAASLYLWTQHAERAFMASAIFWAFVCWLVWTS